MSKPKAENGNKETQTIKPDFAKLKAEAREFLASLSAFDFIDASKPWVLVKDGSFMGVFDFVPPVFRQGSWALIPMMYIASILYLVLFGAIQKFATEGIPDLPRDYYPEYSLPWFCNLAGFLWTSYVFRDVFWNGPGLAALSTYTCQSYAYIFSRFLMSTLSPFFPFLASYNELIRYTVLQTASITFIGWNFILAPAIYYNIKDPERRKSFVQYFTNFRLTQLHFFNIFLAVFSGVYGTPSRPFVWTDLYAALILGMQYCIFYILILDRLGVHLYMIFSPRTNLAIFSWTLVIGAAVGLFPIWEALIAKYGDYWDQITWVL